MRICVPVTNDGQVDHGWGRAHRVAIAQVDEGVLTDWQEHEVSWDVLHDEGTEGAHHARVATFVREKAIEMILSGGMGGGQQRMMTTMGIRVQLGVSGDARQAVLTA